MKELIEHDCDYNLTDESGFTPLHYAVFKNNYEAAKILLSLENIRLDVIINFISILNLFYYANRPNYIKKTLSENFFFCQLILII